MEQMIDIVIKEPEETPDNLSKRFRYPNIVCELLTADVVIINQTLVSDSGSYLRKLLSFLADTDSGKLNPLLASFFAKIFSLLIVKQTEAVLNFFKNYSIESADGVWIGFIDLILKHMETPAVMDLLLKFLTGVDNLDHRQACTQWLKDEDLIPKLIEVFKKDDSFCDQQVNCGQFICDMIKASREHQSFLQEKSPGEPLLDQLESTQMIETLLSHVFESRTECSLVNVMSILQSLLEYKRYWWVALILSLKIINGLLSRKQR